MDKDKTLELLKEFKQKNKNPYAYGSNSSAIDPKDNPASDEFEGFRSEYWIVGGMTGGNDLGDSPNSPVESEPPEEIKLLDKFLEQVMPEITHLQYRKLAVLIQHDDYYYSDYYGNSTDYKVAYIKFVDIADFLSKL